MFINGALYTYYLLCLQQSSRLRPIVAPDDESLLVGVYIVTFNLIFIVKTTLFSMYIFVYD